MKWCPADGGLLEYGPNPSLCFTETFLLFMANALFIVLMGGRLSILRRFPPFDYINIRNAKIVLLVNVLSFVIAALSLILAFISISSLSSIFYALSNAVVWFIIASTIGAESKRLARWPSIIVIVLLMINVVGHSVLASVLYQDNYSRLFFLCAAASLVCMFVILTVATLKDIFLSPEDVNEEELRRFSIEFTTTSPIRQPSLADHFCSRLAEAVSLSFSGSSDPGLSRPSTSTVRRTRLDFTQSENSWMNIWPFRPTSTAYRGSDFQSLLEEDLMTDPEGDEGFLQPNQYNNSSPTHRNSLRSSHSSILGGGSMTVGGSGFGGNAGNFSQIESALDRNVQGNFSPIAPEKEKETKSSGLTSYFFGSRSNSTNKKSSTMRNSEKTEGSKRSNSPTEWEPRDSEVSAYSGRESSVGGGSSNVSRTGKVVAQILEEHRARLAATTPVLEPRGNELGVPGVSSSSMRLDPDAFSASLSGGGSGGGFDSGPSSRHAAVALLKSKRSLRVSVQRWGYRAKRAPGSTSPKPPTLATVNNETEFEIVTASITASNATSATRWTIWKTVSEVYRLHSTMVGLLGDFAPRRPALRSDSNRNTSNTNLDMLEDQVDFNADMRALAVYLNALFRVEYHDNPHIPVLLDFLSVPREFLFPVGGNTSSNPGGNTTNDALNGTGNDGLDANGGDGDMSGLSPLALVHEHSDSGNKLSPKGSAGDLTPMAGEKSLMDMAHKQQLEANQQEKWRKLVVQMKMKLRPRDIAVRCRLFEGVISGGDIASFLMRVHTNPTTTDNSATASSSNAPSNTTETYEVARDRFEACHIGQELLSCGLLLPISLGFASDDDPHAHDDDYNFDVDDDITGGLLTSSSKKVKPNTTTSTGPSGGSGNNSADSDPNKHSQGKDFLPTFSDLPGFIYRFPGKSGTAGTCALFGTKVQVRIPVMDFADENDLNRPVGRETMALMATETGLAIATQLDGLGGDSEHGVTNTASMAAAPTQGSHVIYFVETTHGNDTWQVTRRYREFEQFSKALNKEGIRPEVPVRVLLYPLPILHVAVADSIMSYVCVVAPIEVVCQCLGVYVTTSTAR